MATQQTDNLTSAPAAQELSADSTATWLGWRGPTSNGIAADGQTPETTWSDSDNVLWKVALPGRGHASPTVVNGQIVLATSDKSAETQSVASFDFATGEKQWETVVNTGNFNPRIYPTNTHASSTVASNGELLFAVFNNNKAAQLVALNLQGEIQWSKKAADFIPKRYQFGFGSSPIIYKDTVIVCSECEKDGSMVAFNTKTGDEVWRVDRTAATSYSTPVVAKVGGKEQLVLSGARTIIAYDPSSGEKLWETPAKWTVTCGTAVWNDEMVFVSGGFPAAQTLAIKGDGSGEIVWENRAKCYEQSMLYHDGYLYGLADTGVCYCWDAKTGEEMWKERLEDKVSASPVYSNGNIYISVERGTTYVFKANPEKFELVAKNKLGDIAYATPSVVDNKLLLRVGVKEGEVVQEWLYCIGK